MIVKFDYGDGMALLIDGSSSQIVATMHNVRCECTIERRLKKLGWRRSSAWGYKDGNNIATLKRIHTKKKTPPGA